jgi:hypothetical protein
MAGGSGDITQCFAAFLIKAEPAGRRCKSSFLKVTEQRFHSRGVLMNFATHGPSDSNDTASQPTKFFHGVSKLRIRMHFEPLQASLKFH